MYFFSWGKWPLEISFGPLYLCNKVIKRKLSLLRFLLNQVSCPFGVFWILKTHLIRIMIPTKVPTKSICLSLSEKFTACLLTSLNRINTTDVLQV